MFSQLTFLSLKTYFWTNTAIPMFIGIKGVKGSNQKAYILVPMKVSLGIANIKPKIIKPLPLIINQVINNAKTPFKLPIDFITFHNPFKNLINLLPIFFFYFIFWCNFLSIIFFFVFTFDTR